MSEKIDLTKILSPLYQPPTKAPVLVEVPSLSYLMINGHGNPNNSPQYQSAIEALFSFSYTLKFAVKKNSGMDYRVMPPEGLWWVKNMADFSLEHKEDWDWTMMILQPEFITADLVEETRRELAKKKELPLLPQVRLEVYHEGPCVQLMHIGPYADEAPNINRMYRFMAEEGLVHNGKHHEIYLSDVRRTAPEKLKTILRQPVRKKD